MNGEIAITVIATGFPISGQGAKGDNNEEGEIFTPKTVADAKRMAAKEAAAADDIKNPRPVAKQQLLQSSKDSDIPDFINKLRRRK